MTPPIVSNISRGWNRDPSGLLVGGRSDAVSAAYWTHDEDNVQTLTATPDPTMHVLAIRMSTFVTELRFEGRLAHDGPVQIGSASILRSGDSATAVSRGSWRVLHIYVPTSLCDAVIADEQLASLANGAELPSSGNIVDPTIERWGREILAEMHDGLPLARLRIDCLGQDLLIRLIRVQLARSTAPQRRGRHGFEGADWRFRRAAEMLEDRIGDDLSVADLARAAGVSAVHITNMFRRTTGFPPHQWLLRRRMARARSLLRDTDEPITEIALRCGFSSSQHLATVFKRFFDVPPTVYRRTVRA